MKRQRFDGILKACCFGAAVMAVYFAQSRAFAQGGPTRVSGGGEATAAAFVQYAGHDGVIRDVPSVNTMGNRITFGFHARKSEGGKVQGQMQLVDHNLGLVVHSDVVSVGPHSTHKHPVGSTGPTAFRMRSSPGGVSLNGEVQPGWTFLNSPFFDGGEGGGATGDTVCFELFDADGVRLLQWSAFISSGNVQVVE